MTSKRQTTMAKRAREQKLQEKRERKQEKKKAAAADKAARLNGGVPVDGIDGETELVDGELVDPVEGELRETDDLALSRSDLPGEGGDGTA
jgi:hypothetical protein